MAAAGAGHKDEIFQQRIEHIGDFAFNESVVAVFDDIVDRSVPQYAEIERMLVELACEFVAEGSNVVDLGCSTLTRPLAPRSP